MIPSAKTKLVRLISIAFLLLITLGLQANPFEEKSLAINLNGKWKFSVGDKKEWSEPDFDDTKWSLITAPRDFEQQGYLGYNGYAWYRKTIEISDSAADGKYFFICDHIDDVDQTFFNGTLIGGEGTFPPEYETAWAKQRLYEIPSELIKKGQKNVIAIRVYDNHDRGGITFGKIGIYIQPKIDFLVELNGKWKYKEEDNKDFSKKNFNHNNWPEKTLPEPLKITKKAKQGHIWYRKQFTLKKDNKVDKYVLILGKIADIDEVFINGKIVGWTGPKGSDIAVESYKDRLQFRAYYISPDDLEENNTISIRVKYIYGTGGIYTGPLGIITQDTYINAWNNYKSDCFTIEDKKVVNSCNKKTIHLNNY